MVIATIVAYFARFFRQPLIPAYILAGIIIGPVLGMITNTDLITNLSEIGIAFLLFIVGLEIDIKKLRHVGMVASIGGLIQVFLTFTVAFIISLLAGFLAFESLYISLIVAMSSTMVIVKILSDKKEIDTLHGKIIIGILLVQDFVAIIALSVLVTLNQFSLAALMISLLKGMIVLILSLAVGKYVFPPIFAFAARSQELLFVSSVAISLLYSIMFSYIGFSMAIGAFVAGISLANLPYNIEIAGKIKPLRDFFAVMFFASLGMGLVLGSFTSLIKPFILMLLLAIIAKPIIVVFTTAFFGYKKKTSFLTAISLAQVSEFSLIIVAQGLLLGHISQEMFSTTVLVAIITITLTSYLVSFEEGIYGKCSGLLSFFDRFSKNREGLEYTPGKKRPEIIVCGYNRIGYGIVRTLRRMGKRMLIVDYNPETVKSLIDEKTPALYGDVSDEEVIGRLDFRKASILISTIPAKSDNILLVTAAKRQNKNIAVFVVASHIEEALELYDAGADYVVLPHFIGGEHLSLLLEKASSNLDRIIEYKLRHISELKERHALGHDHPSHSSWT